MLITGPETGEESIEIYFPGQRGCLWDNKMWSGADKTFEHSESISTFNPVALEQILVGSRQLYAALLIRSAAVNL